MSDINVSAEVTRSVAGKTARKIRIGTIYPATTGVLPAFLSKIARKYPDIQLQIQSGSTGSSAILSPARSTSASSGRWRTSAACASYTERYFAEMFAEHDLARNIAYTCHDAFALISLVLAGLGIGFAPQWTTNFPNRNFELRKVRGVDFRIGMGVAWNTEDSTASRDDIIDIARPLVRPPRQPATQLSL